MYVFGCKNIYAKGELTVGKVRINSVKKLKMTFLWNPESRAAKSGAGSGARVGTGAGNSGTAIHPST